ncbi:MAG: hypothetical protein KY453_12350 [Gemmatimonadetes bacterium]|nr:hypothetical protein [Gemmatimonadota bacterium]
MLPRAPLPLPSSPGSTVAPADPRRAPAALAVAGYVEHAFGAWHPRGGLYEVVEAMADLADSGCQVLTIGQYLQPTHKHLALQRYAPPEEYERYRSVGRELGFAHVEAGPLVRSSFRAGAQAINAGVWRRPERRAPA